MPWLRGVPKLLVGRSQPAGSTLWLARARLQKQRRWVSPPGSAPHFGEARRHAGSGQGASALLTSSPRVEGRRGGRRSRPQGAAPADWLLAEGGLREACDG